MPLTDSRGQGIPYAVLTDSPNAQTLSEGIVAAVVDKLNMRFDSASHRGAVITAPEPGMLTWVEDVALLQLYDGDTWVTVASGSSVWTNVPLAAGFTHNGNDNGNFQYRLVNLFGEPTIMFRGAVNITYSGTDIANGGVITGTALPAGARPVTKRSIAVPCSILSSAKNSLKLDLEVTGHLRLNDTGVHGPDTVTPPWAGFNGVFCSL